MYQSLHTTLIGSTGQPFEIQIRTYEMHKAAEYGIAAHWKYKAAADGKKVETQEEEKMVWLRQILEWQRDTEDNKEFLSQLRNELNLYTDSVYCFTPTGDVKSLPAGSTPVDFAYAIHSAVVTAAVPSPATAAVTGSIFSPTEETFSPADFSLSPASAIF